MVAKAKRANGKPYRATGRVRGVSMAEYLALRRMVKRGDTTWAKLERAGIVLASGNKSDAVLRAEKALARK